MLEQLFKILEEECSRFDLQYAKGNYRLILDADKDFVGSDIQKLLEDAIDYLDEKE